MILKDYQEIAKINLTQKVEKAIKSPDNEVVIFQAPTGSGKTVMVSEVLKELVKNAKDSVKYSFVWISVRMLHEQSKEKLEKYYEDDRLIKCSYFEDLEDKKISENEILFINWHSINKKDINIYVKENEQDNNLNAIITNTKDEGRKIVMIIDESHHTAKSDKSKELIETISPKVTIEVSATPHLTNASEIEKIRLDAVKAEEMIKSEISVNPDFLKIKTDKASADELVIKQALSKREQLAEAYGKEGANINPLVLVQLPDNREGETGKKDDIAKILGKYGITEKNGKLAIWLSEDKSDNLPNIEKHDNEVEVLIFKQAIALGWDCPRASILVLFRESTSFIFTIQTLGRIMRMPELKYYLKEPELNKGFVFTNLENIEITEDYAKDYITIYEARKDAKAYSSIALLSAYLKRQRERSRLSGEFTKIFAEVAEKTDLTKKVNRKPSVIVNPIIADGKIIDIDKSGQVQHGGEIKVALDEKELQVRFDKFVYHNCSPYAPADSSDRMKNAIYQYFKKEFKIDKYDPKVQAIVLGKENIQNFIDALTLAKDEYKKKVVEALSEVREIVPTEKWEVPAIVSYNSRYREQAVNKSVLNPFFIAEQSQPEKKFIERLEKSKNVVWWYKNGEGEIKYFAIPYKDENQKLRAFYVDFIIMFKDGRIGLFDTKEDLTAKDAKYRAEGLQKYISEQNKKGKKLWGGIVIPDGDSFRYNDKVKYTYNPEKKKDWQICEI